MCVALPGKVAWIGRPAEGTIPARVELPSGAADVDLVLVPEARVGDYVVAHAGFALRIVSYEQARATLRMVGLSGG